MREEQAKTALVVEDNWVMLSMLRSILQADGLDVLIAPEPTAAIALLRARKVDIVLTDFFFGTTPEACRRSLDGLIEAAGGAPILGVTARYFDPLVAPEEYGVNEIVAKPFDLNDLLDRVQGLLRQSSKS